MANKPRKKCSMPSERFIFWERVCVCVCSVTQSCPTLWDPMDYSLPGSSVHEIPQARILEWVAISFSRESSQSRDRTHFSCICCWQADSLLLCHLGSPLREWAVIK